MKVFMVASPQRGQWTVRVSSSVEYSIVVTANSTLSFGYQLVSNVTRGHGGYKELDYKPATGKMEWR